MKRVALRQMSRNKKRSKTQKEYLIHQIQKTTHFDSGDFYMQSRRYDEGTEKISPSTKLWQRKENEDIIKRTPIERERKKKILIDRLEEKNITFFDSGDYFTKKKYTIIPQIVPNSYNNKKSERNKKRSENEFKWK